MTSIHLRKESASLNAESHVIDVFDLSVLLQRF